jgi:hypothetical protein
VQLHVVEELLQMLNCSDTESEVDQAPEQTEQLAALSGQVARGDVVCNCESLLGWLHGQPVKLLIDFGSSSSFINQRLVSKGNKFVSYLVRFVSRLLVAVNFLVHMRCQHVNGGAKGIHYGAISKLFL